MKKLIVVFIGLAILSCGTTKKNPAIPVADLSTKYASTITDTDLKTIVYTLASDEFQGRRTGEEGQKIAAKYIVDFYKSNGIDAPKGYETYLQEIPQEFFRGESKASSENVIAFIEGSEKPEEVLVLSAHYDHLGQKGEKIYNGADDDASGTSAVLEIAQAFQAAKNDGNGPKRSILFLNVTGEEEGLYGSKFYTSNPIYPLANTVANLNIDMVGRIDDAHQANPNYVYLIGSDKLSSELHTLSEATNAAYTQLDLDYTYNDEKDPNRFYYRSDHYNFAKNNIPIIFYFNGVHADYHKPTDTADKINYELLEKRTQLVFYTAWEIANRETKLNVDK
jgi:Zn-dependent M28 family amino/carboxypeptidase